MRSDEAMPETGAGLGAGRVAGPLGSTAANGTAAVSRELSAIDGPRSPTMLRRAVECPTCRVLVPLAGIDGHPHFQVVDL
jgi:hypothetical protein